MINEILATANATDTARGRTAKSGEGTTEEEGGRDEKRRKNPQLVPLVDHRETVPALLDHHHGSGDEQHQTDGVAMSTHVDSERDPLRRLGRASGGSTPRHYRPGVRDAAVG